MARANNRSTSTTAARGRGTWRRTVRRNPQLPNDLNAPTQRKRYHSFLVDFMEHKNSEVYPSDKTFTEAELLTIVPEDLYRWMCKRMFGREDPTGQDLPLLRSSSLAYYKKAISYFMPNSQPWTVDGAGNGVGNPTRSKKIIDLVKSIKKKETRGSGKKTSADRAFDHAEFIQLIDIVGTHPRTVEARRYQAMIKFQLHLIGRSDDTAHVKKSCLEKSEQFPGYLNVTMRWSKNVSEERDCPKQLILGSMNAKYCCLLGLSLFLEKWIADGEGAVSQWLFGDGVTDDDSELEEQNDEAILCKNAYQNTVKQALLKPAFTRSVETGKLGSHSIKKYASTKCRRGGASKDDLDYRARWKTQRMQDRYTDTQLDWPDVNAATKLCEGGVCLYKEKDNSGITEEWLARAVAPAISQAFGVGVGKVLAKPLIWACFDASAVELVPPDIKQKVIAEFIKLQSLPDGVNPIDRIEVIASESGGSVSLDMIPNDEDGGERVNGETPLVRSNTQWRAAIYAKVSSTSRRVTEMQNNQIAEFAVMNGRLRRMEEIVRGMSVAPARRIGGRLSLTNVRLGTPTVNRPATLAKGLKTLELLWDEYQNGIGGAKPARDFTPAERGRVKFRYSRRLILWKCIERLVVGGCNLNTAITRIKRVYGDVSVTDIIKAMRRDERNGGHHCLR